MSTRSVIARVGEHEGEFSGTYHHWDGAPTSLGAYLWKLLHGHFKNDLGKMLRTLIDEHNSWSTIVGKDFKLKPGFTNIRQRPEGMSFEDFQNQPLNRRPQCHCHGERHEHNDPYTHKSIEGRTDIEYLYLFSEDDRRLYVRDVQHDAEIIVELADPEPDWESVECGGEAENWRRCGCYAWRHNLLPKTSNLSTQTWLGNRPLEFHDVIGFVIGGRRYKSTGSGGNSEFLSRTSGKRFPNNTWVASVQAGNGRRSEMPVARVTKDGYALLDGVKWILPPTLLNPNETVIG